jgi:hypothetical protein
VAGRANLGIDLEAPLQLFLIEFAEGPIAGERQMLGMLVELLRRERCGRVTEVAGYSAD